MKTPISKILAFALLICLQAHSESQSDDYKGITDPFGESPAYEFAEDEKEDKEFFHLGRFLMVGLDGGLGVFTGGLGRSTEAGPYVGLRLIYFFDRALALELAGHYANHLNITIGDNGESAEIDTNMVPINIGFRYYFDTKNAPKAIAISNPYLSFGGGVYIRSERVIKKSANFPTFSVADTTTNNFGAFGGAGVEFKIYRKYVYLGLDIRYHLIFFSDEQETFGAPGVDRSGDYLTPTLTLTYNF